MADVPLLVRLSCTQEPRPAPSLRYDNEADELLVMEGGVAVPAVDSRLGSAATKKKDIEKGEDAKDRW